MSRIPCCGITMRGKRRVAGVIFSTTMLIVMPKCPVCLTAYVALATGLSLSVAAASNLRMALLVVCVPMLLVSLAITFFRFLLRRTSDARSMEKITRHGIPYRGSGSLRDGDADRKE